MYLNRMRARAWGLGLLVLFLAGEPSRGETKTFELTVAAGDRDRTNEPVSVRLPLPASLAKAEVMLKDADGKHVPAQLTGLNVLAANPAASDRELHFVLRSLKAKATTTFTAVVSTEVATKGDGFHWFDTPGDFTELRFGDRPVLRYMYTTFDESTPQRRELTMKVFHHLYDPDGRMFVTHGPGGLYTHHRGLFFGFNKITYGDNRKADIWHCTGGAHQTHEKFLATEAGFVLGRHRLDIAWHGEKKEVFAREERELTVYTVPGGLLVEFATRLRSADGSKIKLDGDPQHAGFQFRAAQEVADKTKNQTIFIRTDGVGKPGEEKQDGDYPWKGMSFVLGEQRYTAAYLDRPDNPKPAHYSERSYGRFGSYFVAEATPERPVEVRYRLWLQKGEMKGDDIAALATSFVRPVEVTVK